MRIAQIELFPISLPFRGTFRLSRGTVGSPQTGRPSIVIRITDEEGFFGWGEAVPVRHWSDETPETVLSTLERYWAPALLGMSVYDLDAIHRRLDAEIAPGYTLSQPIARSGLDMALHDLIGRRLGLSLPEYWGLRRREAIELSWTVAPSAPSEEGSSPSLLEEVEAIVAEGKARGYRHFNIKVGHGLEFDRQVARRVRELAPEGFLWADANGGYPDVERAKQAMRALAEEGVAVLEQPLPPNLLTGYRELRRFGALPVIVDEGCITPRDLLELIRLDAIGGMAMKPARVGGLRNQLHMALLVQTAGLLLLGSGLTDPAIGFAASVLLYGAVGLEFPAALNGPQFLADQAVRRGVLLKGPIAHLPTEPGLGVEVDESKLEALAILGGRREIR